MVGKQGRLYGTQSDGSGWMVDKATGEVLWDLECKMKEFAVR